MVDQLLAGKRVLVVEDEMLVLMAIEDMLADLGCTSIAAAATIEQALSLIEAESFDLATVDVNLDGQRSDLVAKALSDHGVPFAFSSGYGKTGVADDYRDRPMLNKPYSYAQFIEVLTEVLDSKAVMDATALPA